MPRKKKETSFDSIGLRWEFIRRNKKYADLYEKYKDENNPEKKCKILEKIASRFLIEAPLDPRLSFLEPNRNEAILKKKVFGDKIYRKDGYRSMIYDYLCFRNRAVAALEGNTVLTDDYFVMGWDENLNKRFIDFRIDIEATENKIVDELKKIIKYYKKQRKKSKKSPGKKMQDFTLYKTYLEIYDLRYPFKGKSKTYREIAKAVYFDEYKKFTKYSSNKYDISPLTEKVKNNLLACKKLIEGDYQIIR